MVLPGSKVETVPSVEVVVVVVDELPVIGLVEVVSDVVDEVLTGLVVVDSVVVVLVCANATGAINAQPSARMVFFIVGLFLLNFESDAARRCAASRPVANSFYRGSRPNIQVQTRISAIERTFTSATVRNQCPPLPIPWSRRNSWRNTD